MRAGRAPGRSEVREDFRAERYAKAARLGPGHVERAMAVARGRALTHRDDPHARAFQYADNHLRREEARRIAKAISRLPELLRRPTY